MKIIAIISAVIIGILVSYAVGYTVSENNRLSYEKSLKSPSALFTDSKNAVIKKCKADVRSNDPQRCGELRLSDMNNLYVESGGQEQYIFTFASASTKTGTTLLYNVTIGQADGRITEIEKGSLDLLDAENGVIYHD